MNSAEARPRPALREPMLWLVAGLPVVVVIAGFATLAIAIRAGGADALPDSVRRTAQVQQIDLGPDRVARDEGLHAEFSWNDDGSLRLAINAVDASHTLLLQLIHPSDAAQDRQLALTPEAAFWTGTLPKGAEGHDWRLQLSPADRRWRLHGRWRAGESSARLEPALAGE
ncbi:MAG: FixH family protein [Lysobacteraceae bacterium]